MARSKSASKEDGSPAGHPPAPDGDAALFAAPSGLFLPKRAHEDCFEQCLTTGPDILDTSFLPKENTMLDQELATQLKAYL